MSLAGVGQGVGEEGVAAFVPFDCVGISGNLLSMPNPNKRPRHTLDHGSDICQPLEQYTQVGINYRGSINFSLSIRT